MAKTRWSLQDLTLKMQFIGQREKYIKDMRQMLEDRNFVALKDFITAFLEQSRTSLMTDTILFDKDIATQLHALLRWTVARSRGDPFLPSARIMLCENVLRTPVYRCDGWTDVWESGSYGQLCVRELLQDFDRQSEYKKSCTRKALYYEGLKWRPRQAHVHSHSNVCDDLCTWSLQMSIARNDYNSGSRNLSPAKFVKSMYGYLAQPTAQNEAISWFILISALSKRTQIYEEPQDFKKHLKECLTYPGMVKYICVQPDTLVYAVLDVILEAADEYRRPNTILTEASADPKLAEICAAALRRISLHTGLLPRALFQDVEQVGEFPAAAGGMSDVYKGTLNGMGVALKVLREFQYGDPEEKHRKRKRFYREALIWRQLRHKHIQTCLGVYDRPDQLPCIVSPWNPEGNLISFLKSSEEARKGRINLLIGIADALHYLHSLDPPLVHGDLKGANILIHLPCTPKLTDFGISDFVRREHALAPQFELDKVVKRYQDPAHSVQETSYTPLNVHTLTNATAHLNGTLRWMAPEALAGTCEMSTASDMYSFACVCLEAYTAEHPWREVNNDIEVLIKVLAGERPMQPEEMSVRVWRVVQRMWNQSSDERPTAEKAWIDLRRARRRDKS